MFTFFVLVSNIYSLHRPFVVHNFIFLHVLALRRQVLNF